MARIAPGRHGTRGKLRGAARHVASGAVSDLAKKRREFESSLEDESFTEREREKHRAEFNEAEKPFLYEVDPDCWDSVVIFLRLQNQWQRNAMDGKQICLPIERIESFLNLCYYSRDAAWRCQIVDDVMLMANEALDIWHAPKDTADGR